MTGTVGMSDETPTGEHQTGALVVAQADLELEAPEQSIIGLTEEQQQQAEAFAIEFLKKVLGYEGSALAEHSSSGRSCTSGEWPRRIFSAQLRRHL